MTENVTTAKPTRQDVEELALRYRVWGSWGADDELGALNYITDEMRRDASSLVRRGKVFSLALPLDANGPMTGAFGRTNPSHMMLWDGGDIAAGAQDHIDGVKFTDDAAFMALQSSTQWDALGHIFYQGEMYNGHGTDQVTSKGALKNSMTQVKDKAVGRGVLLDVARYRGVEDLPTSYVITAEDLEGTAEEQGVEVGEGDFVLVRTGQQGECRRRGVWGDFAGGAAPGLGLSTADFFCPRHVAAVATDTWGTEVLPNETPDFFQPLHVILLMNAGIHLGEMWEMEELADDCAADGVYEFFLSAPPLTFTGSVGSPVNPQAIK